MLIPGQSQRLNGRGMTFEAFELSAAFHFPDSNHMILTGRDNARPILAHCHSLHLGRDGDRRQLTSIGEIPTPYSFVRTSRDDFGPVLEDRQCRDDRTMRHGPNRRTIDRVPMLDGKVAPTTDHTRTIRCKGQRRYSAGMTCPDQKWFVDRLCG